MKKKLPISFVALVAFLLVSYFIPSKVEQELTISNTYQNGISAIFEPRNWINWDPSLKKDWQSDSNACHFSIDTVNHSVNVGTPNKKIKINRLDLWKFHIEESGNSVGNELVLVIGPYIGDKPLNVDQNSKITYAYNSNLFYKIFPFLGGRSFAEKTIAALSSFLNDPIKFYGFPIEIKPSMDSLFITKRESILRHELFTKLPLLFDSLNAYAKENKLEASNRNVAYNYLLHDSVEVLVGININKIIDADEDCQFMEMPGKQPLAVAEFEGRFSDRPKVYAAAKKYLFDHQLATLGVCFEKYLSALPLSDSSMIKMELMYPLRAN